MESQVVVTDSLEESLEEGWREFGRREDNKQDRAETGQHDSSHAL